MTEIRQWHNETPRRSAMICIRGVLFITLLLLLTAAPVAGSGVIDEGTDRKYECGSPVENGRDAAACFSFYFGEQLKLLRRQRGVMPPIIEEMMRPVSEDDIFFRQGCYHIDRGGDGSPYFIREGIIYLKLE